MGHHRDPIPILTQQILGKVWQVPKPELQAFWRDSLTSCGPSPVFGDSPLLHHHLGWLRRLGRDEICVETNFQVILTNYGSIDLSIVVAEHPSKNIQQKTNHFWNEIQLPSPEFLPRKTPTPRKMNLKMAPNGKGTSSSIHLHFQVIFQVVNSGCVDLSHKFMESDLDSF